MKEQQQIPFFSLEQQTKQLSPKLTQAILRVLNLQQFIGGASVATFEKQFAHYLKTTHAISVNSGTDALWLALKALDIKKNDIVLTTPFSFIASSSEIVAHGAHPVFIDIDTRTFNMDPALMRNWLEQNAVINNGQAQHKKTGLPIVGLLTVDLFGQCADYAQLKAIAQEWNLWTIEDCAQSVGAHIDGKMAGTFGDIGTFSFYPTKNLGAIGDGGCCITDNPELAQKILQLKNHGRTSHYNYEMLGINSRLDGLQAAALSIKLEQLDRYNNARRTIADRYNRAFKAIASITIPEQVTGHHVYHQYCIQINPTSGLTRDQFAAELKQRGVGTCVYYPKALCDIAFLTKRPELSTDCSKAQTAAENILALPVWPELETNQVNAIIEAVCAVAQQSNIVKQESACAVTAE
ncbi:MAG: DegT/DnrJ/EryC1/StrS family aminotransferase [Epsilonproteobacteria bacterium]|nr:DegT/DnrJ/EryC1/StrS family aminotransferase [Campylobacterota bacterium]